MFSFLNSAFLFAAAAALIPLIIHLFSRRRRKVVEFSSLRHLKAMQRRQVRRLKLRQWLLLILRMLIILMVVLAFARPTIKTGGVGSHGSVAAVIILDNSMSMDRYESDGRLFDLARDRTRQLLATFQQADRVALLPMIEGGDGITGRMGAAPAAESYLDQVKLSASGGDLAAALGKASEMLQEMSAVNREIFIVSDRQRRLLPNDTIHLPDDTRLYLVDLPVSENRNRGVVSVSLGGQLLAAGQDFDLVASVRNYSDLAVTDGLASLFLDGRRVSQTDYQMEPTGETTVRFTTSVSRPGLHSGFVEISDDPFLPDNRYYFSFRIPEQFNLLMVDNDPAAQFVALALAPNESSSGYWSVKRASVNDLVGINLYDYNLIMLIGAPKLGVAQMNRLRTYVDQGNALFVTYDLSTDINDFNASYTELTGVTYDSPARSDFSRAGYYSFLSIDKSHPIFSVFDFKEGELPQIKFYTLPRMHVGDSASVIIKFTGDHPALVENRYGNGRVITFTGPLGPDYGDIVSHGFFVPFIARTAEYLATSLTTLDTKLLADEPIVRALPKASASDRALELITPDSSLYQLPPQEQEGGLVVNIRPTDLPGIYRLKDRGQEIDRMAINLDPAEADLQQVDPEQLATAVGASDPAVLEVDAPLASTIASFRRGRELWQWFVWLALIFLAAEMLLSRGAKIED